jgi:hypothetical protein
LCCNTHVWTYTYTIDIPDFTCRLMVLNGQLCGRCHCTNTTGDADACGNTITPVPGTTPSPLTCEGRYGYTFTYT